MKSKVWKKIVCTALIGATCVSSLFALGSKSVEAATPKDEVSVEIFKLEKGNGADITNTGESQTITGHDVFSPSKGAVGFTLYDVTSWIEIKAVKKLEDLTTTQINSYIDQIITLANGHKTGTNGAYNDATFSIINGVSKVGAKGSLSYPNGSATFTNVNNKNKAYVALETKKPAVVTDISVPLVFVLPMTKVNSTGFIDDIKLYAKNEISTEKTKILKKTGVALDGTEIDLQNASFALYRGTPGSGTKVATGIKTNGSGEISMDKAYAQGTYYLVEESVPDPYLVSPKALDDANNELRFKIDNTGYVFLDKSGAETSNTVMTLKDYAKPGGEKDSNEAGKAKEIGSEVEYTATIDVPQDVADWKTEAGKLATLKFLDTPSNGLTYKRQSLVVKDGATTLKVGTDYHFEYQGTKDVNEGFYINLFDDLTGKVINPALAGKKLTLTYSMTVTKDAVVESAVKNNWEIKYNNGPENETSKNIPNKPVVVTTGGHKFKKVGDDGTTPLPGAKFIVSQGTNYFEGYDADGVTPKWTTTKADAFKFETTATGLFEVKGFAEGTYTLEEVEAPADYQLAKETIDFTIIAPTFKADGSLDKPGTYGDAAKLLSIKNNKKSKLPVTGGMGTIAFAVVGLAILSGGVIFYRKKIA